MAVGAVPMAKDGVCVAGHRIGEVDRTMTVKAMRAGAEATGTEAMMVAKAERAI